jgi:oligopeptide/dipeptide ABC transporter ATP-binding protein
MFIEIKKLTKKFQIDRKHGKGEEAVLTVLQDVDLQIQQGEFISLLGASGCGKTTLLRIVSGLLAGDGGTVTVGGRLVTKPRQDLSMVFQNFGLLPWRSVLDNVAFPLEIDGQSKEKRYEVTRKLLTLVGLASFERHYPHELSGGMQQRAMIAMALAGEPVVLIADEPTTALDARIASQILDLLDRLRRERGLALLLISHDLAVIGGRCDRVMVMYSGRIVEAAPAERIFSEARHPYTAALIEASPGIAGVPPKSALRDIPGQLPAPGAVVEGCAFAPRCTLARPACSTRVPQWSTQADAGIASGARGVRCLQYEEGW